MAKIMITARQGGSVNILAPVAKELIGRGGDVDILHTGLGSEAEGFKKLELTYWTLNPDDISYSDWVRNYDVVLVGLSGSETPDAYFLRAAIDKKIPNIAVADQDAYWRERLGGNSKYFPTKLAVMDAQCEETIRRELGDEIGGELERRAEVVGWAAFENHPEIRKNFTKDDKKSLLEKIGLSPNEKIFLVPTQNVPPDAIYWRNYTHDNGFNVEEWFAYEMKVTKAIFETAFDLGLELVVKPHPREEFGITENLARQNGFYFVSADACSTKDLILASDAVIAGRSTSLLDACCFDINTAAILPDISEGELVAYPSVFVGAIPCARSLEEVEKVIDLVTNPKPEENFKLGEDRKKFIPYEGDVPSVRIADLVEILL